MQPGEMNQVKIADTESVFCNYKWLVLGSTPKGTNLVGWMQHGKGWQFIPQKYATYNILDAYGHRSQYRNRKPLTFFWGTH